MYVYACVYLNMYVCMPLNGLLMSSFIETKSRALV